ncbi:hypothetical protein LENED_002714 [Lentinula edodes]|uniref:RNase H type-1 domain-containing protein n=1 Tax=Lentinula edodes TaxID=5353 RepID=A0A1Q3E1L7_LENED|nr:hypothetical protein LENED_002714 [Lentinula edodes]
MRSSPTDLLDIHTNLLPMDLMLEKICHRAILRIYTLPDENPIAIEALESRLPKSGQNIIEATLRTAKRMAKANNTEKISTIAWIPGHCGIEGNERADREAKKAAEGNTSAKQYGNTSTKA